ncbi:MAG TPA: hypothetical protein VIV11_04785 [Kofleriaceae bacterium]
MIRFVYCSLVLALAACPKKGTTAQPQTGAGCPAAAGVYVASYAQQEQGRSGWTVPLHAAPLQGDAPVYATIDAAAASAAGVPVAPPGTLWLATPGGPPCQAKLGNYYTAKFEGPPASVLYGIELDGCAAPKNPDEAGGIVLVSEQSPGGCRFEVPQPIAGRLGETDKAKKWHPPTKESPLPKPLLDALPQKSCVAPACEMLWAFAEVKVGGQPIAWTGAINWLQINNEPDQCAWQAERASGFWIPSQQGGAVKVTEGQEHSLPLIAVLADGSGAKVALAEANGQYATYDLSPGNAKLGHRVVWMVAPPQAWDAVDQLGPICDEDRD